MSENDEHPADTVGTGHFRSIVVIEGFVSIPIISDHRKGDLDLVGHGK